MKRIINTIGPQVVQARKEGRYVRAKVIDATQTEKQKRQALKRLLRKEDQ